MTNTTLAPARSARCLACHVRYAHSHASVVQLCNDCAVDLCPGPDVQAYERLLKRYAWQ